MAGKPHNPLRLVLVFVVQVVVGSALFLLIAGIAVGLNLSAQWLQARVSIEPLIIAILHAVEILILCLDTALFVSYLLREAARLFWDTWS